MAAVGRRNGVTARLVALVGTKKRARGSRRSGGRETPPPAETARSCQGATAALLQIERTTALPVPNEGGGSRDMMSSLLQGRPSHFLMSDTTATTAAAAGTPVALPRLVAMVTPPHTIGRQSLPITGPHHQGDPLSEEAVRPHPLPGTTQSLHLTSGTVALRRHLAGDPAPLGGGKCVGLLQLHLEAEAVFRGQVHQRRETERDGVVAPPSLSLVAVRGRRKRE